MDLETIDDPRERAALESQISEFGQCPSVLFSEPHPRRDDTPRAPTAPANAPASARYGGQPLPGERRSFHEGGDGRNPSPYDNPETENERRVSGGFEPGEARFEEVGGGLAPRRSSPPPEFYGGSTRPSASSGSTNNNSNSMSGCVSERRDQGGRAEALSHQQQQGGFMVLENRFQVMWVKVRVKVRV